MKKKKKIRQVSKSFPSRLRMEEYIFNAMSPEIEREVAEHDLSSEMGDEKAYVLAERIGNMELKTLQKHYKFWVVKLKRQVQKTQHKLEL